MFAFRFVSLFAVTAACLAATGCCMSREAVQARVSELYAAEHRDLMAALEKTCAARGGKLGGPAEGDWTTIEETHTQSLGDKDVVHGVDKIPPAFEAKPPEGATAFMVSSGGGQSRQALCRIPNGDVKVLFAVADAEVEKVRECGCDSGRGMPDVRPPEMALIYWFRGVKPEQVTTESMTVPSKQLLITHSSCGEEAAP